MEKDLIDKLYNAFNKNGNNLGTPSQFRQYMEKPENVAKFYRAFKAGNDFGEYNQFEEKVIPKKKDSTVPSTTKSGEASSLPSAPTAGTTTETTPINTAFSWSAGEKKEELQTPKFDESGAPQDPEQFAEDNKKLIKRGDDHIAYTKLQEQRQGDYSVDAIEIMQRGQSDYDIERDQRRSPLEKGLHKTFGGDGTMAQYRKETGALTRDNELLRGGLDDIDARLGDQFGEHVLTILNDDVAEYNRIGKLYEQSKKPGEKEKYVEVLDQLSAKIKPVTEHPLFKERNDVLGAINKNSAKFNDMMRSDNYATVKKSIDVERSVQEWKDNEASTWELTKDIATKSFSNLAAGLGRVMDIAEAKVVAPGGITPVGDTEYGVWDAMEDWLIDLDKDANILMATPSQFARPLITDTAKWGEFEVDKVGPSLVVRKEGKVVDENPPENLEYNKQTNFSSMPYQMGKVAADMAWMLAGGGIGGKALQSSGVAEGVANRVALATFTAGQFSNQYYEAGLKLFNGDKDKARDYAIRTGLMIGAASSILGPEADILKKGAVASAVASPMKSVVNLLKKGNEEGLEEGLIEPIIERVNQFVISGEAEPMDANENLSNYIMGFTVGALGASGKTLNDMGNSSMLAAAQDPARFAEVSKDVEQIERVNNISEKIKAIEGEVDHKDLPEAIGVLNDRMNAEEAHDKAKAAGVAPVAEKYKAEIDRQDEKLSKLINLPDPPKEGIGAPGRAEGKSPEKTPGAIPKKKADPVDTAAKILTGEPVAKEALTPEVKAELKKMEPEPEPAAPVAETLEERIGERFMEGDRISTDSFKNAGDPNTLKGQQQINLKYLGGTQGVDQMAQELSEEFGIDEQTAQEAIVSFINDNPNGPPKLQRPEEAKTETTPKAETEAEILSTGEAESFFDGMDDDAIKARIEEADSGFDGEILDLEGSDPEGLNRIRVSLGLKPRLSSSSPSNLAAAKEVAEVVQKAFPNVKINFGRYDSPPKGAKRMGRAGFFDPATGEVYLDERVVGKDTPIHEASHLWAAFLKENHNPAYKKATQLARDTDYYKDLGPEYDNMTEEEKGEEALVRAIADNGTKWLDRPGYKKAWDAIWKAVGDLFSKMGYKPSINISSMTFADIVRTASSEITGGRPLTQASSIDVAAALKKEGSITFSNSVLELRDKNFWDKTIAALNKWFTTGRGVGIEFRNKIEVAKNKQQAALNCLKITHTRLFGKLKGADEQLLKDVADVFAGKANIATLPEEIHGDLSLLMKARDQFQELIVNNLIEDGQVILNEDLGLMLDRNYDVQMEQEEKLQEIDDKYEGELTSDLNRTDTKSRYDQFKIRQQALNLKIAEARKKLVEGMFKREFLKSIDIPARTQKLVDQLRKLNEMEPTADREVTDAEKQLTKLRKKTNKEIKEIERDIASLDEQQLTPTEVMLLNEIEQALEDRKGGGEAPTGKNLIDLIQRVKGLEVRLEEKKMEMNETVEIKYKLKEKGFGFDLLQGDGTVEKVNLTKEDGELLMAQLGIEADVWSGGDTGYVDIKNPKMLINNPLYHKLRKGNYVNRSYKKHDVKKFKDNLRKHIGDQALEGGINCIKKTYGDRQISGVIKDSTRGDGTVEYTYVNTYGVESTLKDPDVKPLFKVLGVSPGEIKKIENSPDGYIPLRRPVGKYLNHGVQFNLNDAQVLDIINQVVTAQDMNSVPHKMKVGKMSVDMGPLQKRKDIPEAIRMLMGEYTNPEITIYKTVMKSALIAEQTRSNMNMLNEGLGTIFLEGPTKTHSKPVTKANMPHLGDNKVYYTTDEVYDAMFEIDAPKGPILNTLTFLSGYTKAALTIFSPGSQARNFWGMLLNTFATGNWNLKDFGEAASIVTQDFTKGQGRMTFMSIPFWVGHKVFAKHFGNTGNPEMVAAFTEMAEHGLLESAADIGELQDATNLLGDNPNDSALKKGFKKFTGLFSKGYQANDALGKALVYKNEKALLIESGMDPEKAKFEAAEITKNIMPTYGRAAEFFKQMSRTPLVGNFLLFKAEMFRTRYNIVKQGAKEVKSDNPVIRKKGYQRLASATALTLFNAAIAAGVKVLLGVSDEEEEAIRNLLPKYRENNQVVFTGVKDGKFNYMDFSYINPSSDWDNSIIAAMRGKGPGAAVSHLTSGLFDTDIFLQAVMEAWSNKENTFDREIYQKEDKPIKKVLLGAAHILEPLVPTFVKQTNYAALAAWNDFVIEQELLDEATQKRVDDILSLGGYVRPKAGVFKMLINNSLGFKTLEQDAVEALGYKVRSADRRIRDSRWLKDEDYKEKHIQGIKKELKHAQDAMELLGIENTNNAYKSKSGKNTYRYLK